CRQSAAVDPHSPRPDDGCKPGSTVHPQNSRNARSPACARQTLRKTTRPRVPILPDGRLGYVLLERIRPVRIRPWKHPPSSRRGAKLECSAREAAGAAAVVKAYVSTPGIVRGNHAKKFFSLGGRGFSPGVKPQKNWALAPEETPRHSTSPRVTQKHR